MDKPAIEPVLTVGWWQVRPRGLYEKYMTYYMFEGVAWSYSIPGRGYTHERN